MYITKISIVSMMVMIPAIVFASEAASSTLEAPSLQGGIATVTQQRPLVDRAAQPSASAADASILSEENRLLLEKIDTLEQMIAQILTNDAVMNTLKQELADLKDDHKEILANLAEEKKQELAEKDAQIAKMTDEARKWKDLFTRHMANQAGQVVSAARQRNPMSTAIGRRQELVPIEAEIDVKDAKTERHQGD